MKKVFSLEKYTENRVEKGHDRAWVDRNINSWGKECEGLTAEEMCDIGYMTMDEWMVEVDDEIL